MATITPDRAPEFVAVACKLPNGLVLRLASARAVREPVMGGGSRDVQQFFHIGEPITVFGTSHPQNAAPLAMIVAGFALTPNVPGKFWAAWAEQNKDHAAVKSGLIFAYEKESDVRAAATEKATLKSGMERLDPNKLPRGLKSAKETASAV